MQPHDLPPDIQPRDLPMEPRAPLVDVLRGRARFVGSRTAVGRHDLGLSHGVVSPYEVRAAVGLRYGDPPIEEARYEATRSAVSDASLLARWLLTRAASTRRAHEPPAGRPFVVSSRIDPIDTHAALAKILGWLRARESRHAYFVHPHALNLASNDRALRDALDAADLVLPDGIGIRVAAAILGLRLPANVNGTDLVPELLLELAAERFRVGLIGGAPGVAAKTAETWQRRTGVAVAGVWDGFRSPDEYREAVRALERAAPCVVLVGMGSPLQERFASTYLVGRPGLVTITVGGLFDFESGGKPRAPLAVREVGLEWLWRLAHEPRRLGKRYVVGNPEFLLRALRQKMFKGR